MTALTHPLFGEVLPCSGFKRWNGVVLLVVELPDGSPGTIRADATDVFATTPVGARPGWCWTARGFRRCTRLVVALQRRRGPRGKGK